MSTYSSTPADEDGQLDHLVDVRLAGLIVRFESNSSAVPVSVLRRFDRSASTESDERMACRVRVIVTDNSESFGSGEITWHLPNADQLTVRGGGIFARLDLQAGTAVVRATANFLRRRLVCQRWLIEGIPLTLLTRRDRHPVHAAALCRNDAAVLLHGASGVGKSTLAYAASRAGIAVLADDASRVQLEPQLRVWGDGNRARIRLLENTRRHFPELAGRETDWLAGDGIMKMSVEPTVNGAEPFATRARVCLLQRHAGPVARRQVTPKEVRDALLNAPEAAMDLAPAQRERVVSALAAPGGWHLTLSGDPTEAIPHLEHMLAAIDRA